MGDAPHLNWMETTPDERTMATLAHALQPIGSWIAPLIIFLIRRQSRFVAFHALQALLLQILHVIFIVLLMVCFFVFALSYVVPNAASNANTFPTALFMFFPILWLGFMGMTVGILAIAIIYAVKAGRGEWADYPLIGKLARKILKMAPKEVTDHQPMTPHM